MPEKRPKPGTGEEDTSDAAPAGAREEDDSIEILEVVGMEENGAAVEKDSASRPGGSDREEAEKEIPYSRRELFDMLLRKQADFENARKRLEREREENRRRIWSDLVGQLLPVLDNFDRALTESASGSESGFRQGVALTVQQMREILLREGLEEVSALGERFDPHLHEAVETLPVHGLEAGIVLEELRKGYRFQGQLLRPALVKVSAGGGKEPGEGGT